MEEYRENPIYPLINVESIKNGLYYRGKTEHHIMCHIQDIPENGADILHFKYVHSYITPLFKSIFFRWQAKWMRGDDPNLPSLFEHSRKPIREFKQRVLKEIIEPFPRKEFLSIGSLENDINLPIFGKFFMFSATIIQCGLGIVFVILKGPLFELVFHHYVQPHGKAYQHVFHDCFISWHVPYILSSLVSQLEGGQVTNDMYIWSAKKFARKAFLM
jgi:cholesterol 7-dehydrogenase